MLTEYTRGVPHVASRPGYSGGTMIEALKSDDIVNKVGGRFKLCSLIQRRIVQLMEGSRPLVDRDGRSDLEVVIDEMGRVTNVTVRESVHPMFDSELLNIGRDWKYQPATYYGKPVRYRKMIQINVTKQN